MTFEEKEIFIQAVAENDEPYGIGRTEGEAYRDALSTLGEPYEFEEFAFVKVARVGRVYVEVEEVDGVYVSKKTF